MSGIKARWKWLMPAVLIVVALPLIAYGYVIAIYQMYGRYAPPEWSARLVNGRMGGFTQTLGPPTSNLDVKNTYIWLKSHWWGEQELIVICANLNTDCQPSGIMYRVHVDALGDHMIYSEMIGGKYRGENIYAWQPIKPHSQVIQP